MGSFVSLRHAGWKAGGKPEGLAPLVLIVGFGGLLSLLLIAGLSALSVLRELHTEEQQARAAFLERNRSLLEIRSTIDLYGDHVVRYFLAVHPDGKPNLPDLARQLSSYPAASQPEESALVSTLRALAIDQQRAVDSALAAGNPAGMSRYVCDEVLPRHLRMIEAVEKIAIWDHRQLSGQDDELIAGFSKMRDRLTRLLIAVLGSGLLLAIGSVAYIVSQDREARRRYAEISDLSARLVDAQEEERRSIARELHDEVGQSLGALVVQAGRLASAIPSADAVVQEQVHGIKTTAERLLGEIRDIALLLRPSMLDDLGLIAAIEWQAREVSRRGEMEVEVKAEGVPDEMREDCKICIYRLVQEALNNAARHAGAKHAWVELRRADGKIEVTVRDDGAGFDPKRSRGLGLMGMEERVRRLGGTLQVESKPGAGTTVRAELPVTD